LFMAGSSAGSSANLPSRSARPCWVGFHRPDAHPLLAARFLRASGKAHHGRPMPSPSAGSNPMLGSTTARSAGCSSMAERHADLAGGAGADRRALPRSIRGVLRARTGTACPFGRRRPEGISFRAMFQRQTGIADHRQRARRAGLHVQRRKRGGPAPRNRGQLFLRLTPRANGRRRSHRSIAPPQAGDCCRRSSFRENPPMIQSAADPAAALYQYTLMSPTRAKRSITTPHCSWTACAR